MLGVAPGLLAVSAEVPPDRLHAPLGALLEEVDEFEGGREDFQGLLAAGDQCCGAARRGLCRGGWRVPALGGALLAVLSFTSWRGPGRCCTKHRPVGGAGVRAPAPRRWCRGWCRCSACSRGRVCGLTGFLRVLRSISRLTGCAAAHRAGRGPEEPRCLLGIRQVASKGRGLGWCGCAFP